MDTLQNKDFMLLDIRSSSLTNVIGPMEIFLDLNNVSFMYIIFYQ